MRMRRQGDVSVGDWLVSRVDSDWSESFSMHGVVPRGFDAYARVFHRPTVRRRTDGGRVPSADEWQRLSPNEFDAMVALLVDEPTTWAAAAQAFGTTFHPLAQWHRIIRVAQEEPDPNDWQQKLAPDGREFQAPAVGDLGDEQTPALVSVALRFTTTADDGYATVWAGWGDLGGGLNATGGPQLALPHRDHLLFRGDLRALTSADWGTHMPWAYTDGVLHGARSPGLIWPADRAWVIVTEVDCDSTIVCGTPQLIDAVVQDEELEAWPIDAGADLSWLGDNINPSLPQRDQSSPM